MNRRSLVSLLVVLAVSASALAGPLRKDVIASGAKWAVHLDVEALVGSELGQTVLTMAREADANLDAKLAAIVELVGVDPLKDIKGITLYGTAFDGTDGVAVVQANANKEKVLALLAANAGYKASKIGDRVVHSWIDKNRAKGDDGARIGTFYGDDLVVVARSADALKAALEVMDGNAASLAKDSALLPEGPRGTFLVGGVIDLPVPAKAADAPAQPADGEKAAGTTVVEPTAQLFQEVSGGSLVLGTADGEVFATVSVTTRTEEDATSFRQMAQGLLAFAKMASTKAKDPKAKLGVDLVKNVKVSGEGASVVVSFSAAIKDIQALLQQAIESNKLKVSAGPGKSAMFHITVKTSAPDKD